jgi:FkbM family methyltransferase
MVAHLHSRIGRLGRLTERIPRRRGRQFDLKLRDGPCLRLRSDDVVAIFIFAIGEYDVDLRRLGDVTSLLDLGANVGLASIHLADRLDSLRRIVCIEPAPDSFRLLQVNLSRNLSGAVALQAAVIGKPGGHKLVNGRFPGETQVLPADAADDGELNTLTVSEALDQAEMESVDLMKIDIEGGEAAIFDAAAEWAPRVRAILGEVHPPLTVSAAQSQLREFGFVPLPVAARPVMKDILFVHRP